MGFKLNAMREVSARVLDNRLVAENTFCLELYAPGVADAVLPGQFVMVGCPGAFLRRPISVSGVAGRCMRLVVRVVGKGTRALASLRRNERVSVLGPLGRAFAESLSAPILVAGGIGVAPLLFLAQHLQTRGESFSFLYGERTAGYLISSELLPDCVELATDDGSAGFAGTVVELLAQHSPGDVVACGPWEMLRQVASIAKSWGRRAFVFLEQRMACGIGACQGCVVETTGGYRRVCTDGPVFPAEEVFP